MDNVNIRDVRSDDLECLHELNQSNLPHVGSISLKEMEYLRSQALYFRVVEVNGQIAGFLIAFDPTADYTSLNFLWFKALYTNFIYIDRITISPEARRKGLGFCLYKDLEAFARERNIPIMSCEYNLRPENEISRLFHQRYGFGEVGTQETEGGKKTVSLQIKEIDL